MNTKRTTAILCMTGFVVFCFVAGLLGSNNASAENGESTWLCNVAGTYVHVNPPFGEGNAAVVVTTLVPLDPMGLRLQMIERWPNSAPGWGDIQTPMYGEAVKVGHDTYKFSTIEYTFKKLPADRGELESIIVMVGSLRVIDCDTIETFDVYISVYGPEQDKDGDGFPDSDEKPNMCLGGPGPSETRKRVPMMEPCES
ncbi:hypothetical protein ACFL6U_25155 [Planctomycetota bacterium]